MIILDVPAHGDYRLGQVSDSANSVSLPSAELGSLIECSFEGLIMYSEGKILFGNPAFAAMFGYSLPEIAGMRITDLLPTESGEHDDDEGQAYETIGLKSDGSTFSVEIVSRRHLHEGKRHRVAAIRDISQRRQFEKKIRHAQKLEAVGQLAAGVAHEINNPLTYILLRLEALKGEKIAPERIDEIIEGVERIKTIASDLKMFSRQDDDIAEAVNLAQAVEKAVQMAGNEIRHRARLVEEHLPMPAVLGNRVRLAQVFLNLLINASHAIGEKGNPETNVIYVRTYPDREMGAVEVRDTGEGISSEYLQRIFEPFFTTKPMGMGTGLGLSICRSIVEAYGGRIDVLSKVGEGTIFTVRLPFSETAAPVATIAEEIPEAAVSRILVIDDEDAIRSSIARVLSPPHEVVEASNGHEALEHVAKNPAFDLVICDLMMPGYSGGEFFREVAERFPELREKIVFMTGGAFTQDTRMFLESVPNKRLAKPFRSKQLLDLVNTMLGQ